MRSAVLAVLPLFVLGCLRREVTPERPADLLGSWESASTLTLGGCAVVDEEQGSIRLVLNTSGVCVFSIAAAATCNVYSNMDVSIGGLTLERVYDGGWTKEPAFDESTNGHGYGCMYPLFRVPCTEDSKGEPSSCSSKSLYRASGSLDFTVRIGDESRTFTSSGFTERAVRVTSPLVPGRVTAIETDTPVEGEAAVSFVYDETRKNTAWCAYNNNRSPWGETHPYDESGDCSKGRGCCTSWRVATIAPDAEGKLRLLVPEGLPPGAGVLEVGEAVDSALSSCPFGSCRIKVGRGASVRAVVSE
jgi:hypothetical protein